MSLPILTIPKYKTTLPVSGIEVEYRPFLVKEEKIMIMADASSDDKDLEQAVSQIISNCTFGKINSDDICETDIEWIILQIRCRAKGYNTTLSFQCENEVDGKKCGFVNDIDVDLHNIEVNKPNESNLIDLAGGIGLKMRIPNSKILLAIDSMDIPSLEKKFMTIYAYIESIYSADQVWEVEKLEKEEMDDFFGTFTSAQTNMVEEWISDAPELTLTVDYNCASCGCTDKIEIQGIESFFD